MGMMQPLHLKFLLLHFHCYEAFLELEVLPEVCSLGLGSEPRLLGRFPLRGEGAWNSPKSNCWMTGLC